MAHLKLTMFIVSMQYFHKIDDKIIKCLQNGLLVTGKCLVSRQCILALTVCAIEMQDAMMKLLPEILANLSKISAIVPLAIPKLEFLSRMYFCL